MNWGSVMNMANMPNPKSSAARLVLATAGMRIIFMSTNGDLERLSATTQRTIRTAVAPNRAMTVVSPQPQSGAYEMASRPVTSQADMRTAPSQLIRPGDRTGDSEMNTNVATVAIADMIIGIQNSQW